MARTSSVPQQGRSPGRRGEKKGDKLEDEVKDYENKLVEQLTQMFTMHKIIIMFRKRETSVEFKNFVQAQLTMVSK